MKESKELKRLHQPRCFASPQTLKDALIDYQMDNDFIMRFIADAVDTSEQYKNPE